MPAPAGTLDPAALDEALTRIPDPTSSSPPPAPPTPAPSTRSPRSPAAAPPTAPACTSTPPTAGDCSSATGNRTKLAGLEAADTVALDLHKLGWQPIAAGLLTVKDTDDLTALHHHADYLNADDDTDAGLPDLLGRSPRTSRRPDILKIAVTLRTLGRHGLGALVDRVCALAQDFAALVDATPASNCTHRPPSARSCSGPPRHDTAVAAVRRTLLTTGSAVLGRARADGRLWLKATLLNPHTEPADLAALLALVEDPPEGHTPR